MPRVPSILNLGEPDYAGQIYALGQRMAGMEARFAAIESTQALYDARLTALEDGGSVTPEPDPVPSFTTPPSILSDGSPTVGETLIASDGVVANGSVSGRQWLLAGAAIAGATGATYTPSAAGSYALRVTATGLGGSVDATSTPVNVADAPVVDPGGPPSGFTYLAGADASRLTGADGAYLMGVA